MKHLEYKEHIDALRGIAVLLVVIFHALPDVVAGGFIGVDVFFVISGYLITLIILSSLEKNEFSLKEFYGKRVRCLFPALLTVLLFALIVGWLVLFPKEYEQLGKHVSKSSIFWLNFRLISEAGYFDVESHYKPLLHLWTLSVEEQYYLVWPLILLLFIKLNKSPVYLFGGVIIASMVANIYFVNDYKVESYFHTLTRFWQLASGSLLASFLLKRKVESNRLLFFVGGVFILLGVVVINKDMVYPGYWALLPVCGTLLVIYSNVKFKTYLGLSKVGLISYPLYLWHWVLISFLSIYVGREPSMLMLLMVTAVSFVFAYLTYRYIEKLRYKEVTAVLVVSMVFVGVAGAYVNQYDGLPERNHIEYYVSSSMQFTRTPAKDDGCIEYSRHILNQRARFDYCRSSGLESKKVIAVVGDSHAHALYPGIQKIAEKEGYGTVMLANSSCPPLVGFMWGRNEKEVLQCQEKISQIMQVLKLDTRVEKIIIATRGPVYINGEVKGGFTEKSVAESLTSLNMRNVNKLTYDMYTSSFNKTMASLDKIMHVREVYYLLENPELDFLPKEVVYRPFDYFDMPENRNTMESGLYLKRMSVYKEGIESIKSKKLHVLDPLPAMCEKEQCHSVIDGGFLYADDDHFSVFGAEYIANYFKNDIWGIR